jgi:hypothetical protein
VGLKLHGMAITNDARTHHRLRLASIQVNT